MYVITLYVDKLNLMVTTSTRGKCTLKGDSFEKRKHIKTEECFQASSQTSK